MNEKFEKIENKKEFFAELSVATASPANSLRSNYFYPIRIDKEKHSELYEIVDKILDKRIEYQNQVKKLHIKYFGK